MYETFFDYPESLVVSIGAESYGVIGKSGMACSDEMLANYRNKNVKFECFKIIGRVIRRSNTRYLHEVRFGNPTT